MLGAAVLLSFAVSLRNGSDLRGLVKMSASMSALGMFFNYIWPVRAWCHRKWFRRSINLRRLVVPVFRATRMADWSSKKKGVR